MPRSLPASRRPAAAEERRSPSFSERIKRLEEDLLRMCAEAEEAVDTAVMALLNRDLDLAEEAVERNDRIALAEMLLDKECLDILQVHRPEAQGLRLVTAAMKITNDLDRAGELAAHIAQHAAEVIDGKMVLPRSVPEFDALVAKVVRMLRDSVRALFEGNDFRAREIWKKDEPAVNDITRRILGRLTGFMEEAPGNVKGGLHLIFIVRALERIGDRGTNIAEEAIYALRGEVVRHRQSLRRAIRQAALRK